MKPSNFPERVNQRRKVALNVIAGQSTPRERQEAETLEERIAPSLRHIRTKKDRSGGSSKAGRKAFSS